MWLWRARHRPLGEGPGGPDRLRGEPDGRRVRPERSRPRLCGRQGRRAAALRQELDPGTAAGRLRLGRLHAGRLCRLAGDGRRRAATCSSNDGSGWRVDAGRRRAARSVPTSPGACSRSRACPTAARWPPGEHVVIERDGPARPWRFSDQPLPNSTVIAAAALRDGERVRAVVSVVPRLRYPPPDNLLPDPDPNVPPPLLRPFPLPADGYVLRETGTGWRDEQHTAFSGSGTDRPVKSDPILDFDLDAGGDGWAVGGWSGEADSAGRGSSGRNPTGQVRPPAVADGAASPLRRTTPRRRAQSRRRSRCRRAGAIRRRRPRAVRAARAPTSPVQGIAPDRILSATLSKVARPERPARAAPASCSTPGGRVPPAADQQRAAEEAARYAELLGSQPALPVFPARVGGRHGGRERARYRSALRAASPRPSGTAPAPPGIEASRHPRRRSRSPGARTHYAFDSSGAGGTAARDRDRQLGRLARGERPAPESARSRSARGSRPCSRTRRRRAIPAIVVGSRDLNSRFIPRLNVGERRRRDGAHARGRRCIRLLLRATGGEPRLPRSRAARRRRSPAFGTGTLGYRSPLSDAQPHRTSRTRCSATAASCWRRSTSAQRDPVTNRAPVSVRMIPMVEELSVQALDGTLLRRSRPSLFQGIGRRPRGRRPLGQGLERGRQREPAGRRPLRRVPARTVPGRRLLDARRAGVRVRLLRSRHRRLRAAGPAVGQPPKARSSAPTARS